MLELTVLFGALYLRFRRDPSELTYQWLDDKVTAWEDRLGRIGWAVVLGFILTIAACLYARIDLDVSHLGKYYVALARDPFAFDSANPTSYRLLTPAISWVLGLRGEGLIITNLLFTGVFLAVIYLHFRQLAPRPGDAVLTAVLLAFSLVVLTSIHCAGYCDIVTYLIIYLMWQHRSKRVLYYLLFLLGLLNRESIVFLVPWFAFISFQSDRRWYVVLMELLVGMAAALGLYYLFRLWVESHQTVGYDLNYYTQHFADDPLLILRKTTHYQSLGLFSVYKTVWLIPFLAVASFRQSRSYGQIVSMVLLLVCVWLQLLIAFDSSRMFTLGFMVLPLALVELLGTNYGNFRRWAFWLVGFNLVIPQVYTASNIVEIWQTLSAHYLLPLI